MATSIERIMNGEKFYYCVSECERYEEIVMKEEFDEWMRYPEKINSMNIPLGTYLFGFINENLGSPDFVLFEHYIEKVVDDSSLFNEKAFILDFYNCGFLYTPPSTKVICWDRPINQEKYLDYQDDSRHYYLFNDARIDKTITAYYIDGEYFRNNFDPISSPNFPDYILGFNNIFYLTLTLLLKNNYKINKCKNCGKYFASYKNDANIKYCDNISPIQPKSAKDNPEKKKTCKEYGKYITQLRKNRGDKNTLLHNKIAGRLYQRFERGFGNAKVNDLRKAEENFRSESNKRKLLVKDGKMSKEEYYNWLVEQDELTKKGV